MQHVAPLHCLRNVTTYLNIEFENQWIGRYGPTLWAPRSLDLNSLNFYFWGPIKWIVYEPEINNRNDLWNRIQNINMPETSKLLLSTITM
jgi:hypothetical protein